MTTSPTTQYTITQAHRITGRSRTTLQRHLKKGVLSSTTDEFKNVRIDASELMRVYGADQCDFARARGAGDEVPESSSEGGGGLQYRLETLQQQVEALNAERRREREQLQAQIEMLQKTLTLSQEGHNRATLLLESRVTKTDDWEKAIRDLERRVTGQAELLAERVAAAEAEAKTAAWAELKTRPWWRLLSA